MYKVKVYFEDLQDNRHAYRPGETFPRAGVEVEESRLEELLTGKNRRGVPLIFEVPEKGAEVPKKEAEPSDNDPVQEEVEKPEKPAKPKKKRAE